VERGLTLVNPAGCIRAVFKSVSAWAVVFCLVLPACRTLEPEPAPVLVATNAPPEEPRIRPLDASVGRVLTVNERLRFVVLDYALYSVPGQGRLLVVDRDGAEIGELRVNGPVRDTTVSADILRGEPRPGDRTRPKR
jgi:hypothetical protein